MALSVQFNFILRHANFLLLMSLLVTFLFDPWLPLIEVQMSKASERMGRGESDLGLTNRVRKLEWWGWILLTASLLCQATPIVVKEGMLAAWKRALPYNSAFLLLYGGVLFLLLIISTQLIPLYGISCGIKERQPTFSNSNLMIGLVRFQARGWLGLLVGVAIFLTYLFFDLRR